ncbi:MULTISPECIES: hypothetical protein [unclassified Enterococcus]|uniref:hypothetical protein n=1 Tax=unclassified Enterococcus TaxID=2608891 RepID=UPI00155330A0|nr:MULTISPECIES: hypothetical protein [unclassified Enterococcus]MBS7577472.1 hypothetical protein [Enterococcus sp. MMGLQ5-2]MBS7584878.1 hypothetical protein [Enterococcus sp. MMGLQ5-1]NPD12733.1 hypothetical protein [Enterococcus sp. MMGLQ5-1]NPD37304.1 hypothetical protein [Enterococcus sp. MMGLQ5-2]
MRRVVHVSFFSNSLNVNYHQKVDETEPLENVKQTAQNIYAHHFDEQAYPNASINLQILELMNAVNQTVFFKVEFLSARSVIAIEKLIEIINQLFLNFAIINIYTEYSSGSRIYYFEILPLYFDASGSRLNIDLKQAISQQNASVKQNALAFYLEKELTRYIYQFTGAKDSLDDDDFSSSEVDALRRGDTQAISLNLAKSEGFEKLVLENYHLKLELQTVRTTLLAYSADDKHDERLDVMVKQPILEYQMILRSALTLEAAWNYYLKILKKLSLELNPEIKRLFSGQSFEAIEFQKEYEQIDIAMLQKEVEWIDARVKLVRNVGRQLIAVKILAADLERMKVISQYSELIKRENIRLNALLETRY